MVCVRGLSQSFFTGLNANQLQKVVSPSVETLISGVFWFGYCIKNHGVENILCIFLTAEM